MHNRALHSRFCNIVMVFTDPFSYLQAWTTGQFYTTGYFCATGGRPPTERLCRAVARVFWRQLPPADIDHALPGVLPRPKHRPAGASRRPRNAVRCASASAGPGAGTLLSSNCLVRGRVDFENLVVKFEADVGSFRK